MQALLLRWMVFCGMLLALWAPVSAVATQAPADDDTLHVFVREGCPHCRDAKVFLNSLTPDQLGPVRLLYHDVQADPVAGEQLEQVSRAVGVSVPGVPTFVRGQQVLIGFGPGSESALLGLIQGQTPHDAATAELPTRWFGTLSLEAMGLPAFTLALGLLDGFNPCATWVLLFLLSLLARMQDRRRMLWIAGTFVLASGAVYYAFMAAWLNFFMVLGLSQPIRLALALLALVIGAVNVKDFFAFGRGVSFSIPENRRPGLVQRMRQAATAPNLGLALASVAVLAVVVNTIELLCTAGLPALYTAVLTQQELPPAARYAYLGLYIAGYMADDALMVGLAVFALSRGKLSERGGRWLKLIAGSVMVVLGLVLLLKPEWLM